MSTKAILRLLFGCAIAALILIFLLPAIGIPKSYLLPPGVILGGAKGKTVAYITGKNTGQNPNPFRSTEKVWYVNYQYRVTPPENLLEKPTADELKKKKVYKGHTSVPEELYNRVRNPKKVSEPQNDALPETVPIKFEVTRPDISAITKDGTFGNDQGGGALLGSWILFFLGIFILGYMIAPLLQKVMLREEY
ncbi:MAG: hypothetical protein H7Y38_11625 [Armatimonadetes bacterium]|nr:hypothetical protein [Armatimonadota bacterium]